MKRRLGHQNTFIELMISMLMHSFAVMNEVVTAKHAMQFFFSPTSIRP